MKLLTTSLLVGTMIVAGQVNLRAQDKKNDREDRIKTAITDKRYVFKATSALPLRGRTIQLTSDYTLTVRGDTVIAFLPYFGRAYTAPLDPAKGGIDFTSTNFDYKAKQRKKGNWEINIKPKDADDVRQLYLSFSASGFGNLQVTSLNRQTISFNGHVNPTEEK